MLIGSGYQMSCIQCQLVVASFLGLFLELPVIGKFHNITKDEKMDPAVLNRPSCFGSVVVASHCAENSLDSRLESNSGVGWKNR